MIVTCPKCQAKFNLDETKLPPEGAWVRCSKCDEVFQVFAPGAEPYTFQAEDDLGLDDALGTDMFNGAGDDGIDDDLDMTGSAEAEGKGRGRGFKIFFWLFATILILAILAVGAVITLGRMGVGGEMISRLAQVPYLGQFMGTPAETAIQKGNDPAGTANMVLSHVRGSYRINQHANQIFVVHGRVENTGDQTRTDVLVRAVLLNDKGEKALTASAYAGPTLTPEQLRDLPLEQIQQKLSSPVGEDGSKYVVTQGASIQFMVVFAKLPSNLSEYVTEVVSTKPLQ